VSFFSKKRKPQLVEIVTFDDRVVKCQSFDFPHIIVDVIKFAFVAKLEKVISQRINVDCITVALEREYETYVCSIRVSGLKRALRSEVPYDVREVK